MKRERVINSIKHKNSDIVPWNFELTEAAIQKIKEYGKCEDANAYLNNHMLRIKYKQNEKLADGYERDIFGVLWQKSKDGGDVGNIVDYPMKEDEIGDYKFPEIRTGFASQICDQLEANNGEAFTMFSITMGYFERTWSLRGMENILMDMCLNEEFTESLYAGILEHHMKLLDYILDRNFDAIYIGDDWGQQKGSIMGPNLWRKYIKPGMSQMFEKIKSKGKYIVLHSCGDIKDMLPDLIEMGLDVYNTVQPEIYDLNELKREYGKDLTFYGGISTQQFLPYASADEVKEMTKQVLDTMYQDGGYILSPTHAATPDIPVENLLAMIEVAKTYS